MQRDNLPGMLYGMEDGSGLREIPSGERLSALDELVCLWEASARSTHGFLTEADIDGLRPFVRTALESVAQLWGMADRSGRWVAFMGIDGDMLEMLFVHPSVQGEGFGRKLVELAVNHRGARRVDVNEQNLKALGFYVRMGFAVTGRSHRDGQGNPFPLLHLEWPGPEKTFSG